MFEELSLETFDLGEIRVRARVGGSGPPLLLLHGNPQTHVMWHKVAPALADRFSLVLPDLRGYGMSSKPPSTSDNAPYTKRTMALDQLALMRGLGHERFFVAGHDRGGRVAYRLALDHPSAVLKLAVLDIIPTSEAFERGGREFGLALYHWYFLAQPSPLPEKLIGSDPDWFWRWHTTRGPDTSFFDPVAVDDYLDCFRDPETIRGICEDYRAGATIDFEHDIADKRAGRKIQCPLLVLWGSRSKPGSGYDPIAVWGDWADDVEGKALPCGHYLAEEAPEQTAEELSAFFSQ
ncbi:MAG TPA: alpha/beta hydrolase [Acidimicrobiia bacterium]|nr:alpha/beta hydrolase [Acidimicrobiia bacterium]